MIAIKTPQKVSKIRDKAYIKVCEDGIDNVIINSAATAPITPDLLLKETFNIMVNIVKMGTKIKVTHI